MLPSALAQSRRLVVSLSAALLALGAVVAVPAGAAEPPPATSQPAASAPAPAAAQPTAAQPTAAQPTAVTTALADEVVLSGSTRRVALPGVPSTATSVTLDVEGRWAWRPTTISVCGGTSATCASPRAFTTPTNARGRMQVTVPLAGTPQLTVKSSRASVRVTVRVLGFTGAPAASPAAKPGPANTGVPAGTKLRVHQGDLVITKAGTVVDGVDVRGFVKVRARGVTIKNSIVRGRPLNGPIHLVQNLDGGAGLTIVDSEISAAHPSPYMMGVLGTDFTLRRVDINTVVDQVMVLGDNVTIEDSWLHGNLHYARDPNHGNTPSHDDNIQVSAGSNLRFEGNRLEDSSSAAVMVTQGHGPVSKLEFRDNWIDGGACSVNLSERHHGPLSGMVFTDNTFGTSTRLPYCAILRPLTTHVTSVGNAFVDGRAFALSRG